jgi:hypothetical protein
MYIEDLIGLLENRVVLVNPWERDLMRSLNDQIFKQVGLTQKQSVLALKILKNNSHSLTNIIGQEVTELLENPKYELGIRKISDTKKLDIIEDKTFGKLIKVEFPYNENFISMIREKRNVQEIEHGIWDKDEKSWKFALTEKTIQFLSEFVTKENFEITEEFLNYISQAEEIQNYLEKYLPILVLEEGKPKLQNCDISVPKIETDDILEAIFLARRYGITTWDTEINNFVEGDQVPPAIYNFLKSGYKDALHIDPKIHDFSAISTIIKYMSPCLFVIPGGMEYEKTMEAYQGLRYMGIDDHEMSVMFRLPTEIGGNFNNFVKNNGLNSPIGPDTKIVFVSGKLPKPVIKSKIKFQCVINLGYDNAHYTMKEFLKNHENMIFYTSNLRKVGVGLCRPVK